MGHAVQRCAFIILLLLNDKHTRRRDNVELQICSRELAALRDVPAENI